MKKIIAIALTVALSFGCANYIDLKPLNSIDADNYYKTQDHAFAAIMAAYSNLQNLHYYGKNYIEITEYSGDDITSKLATSNNLDNLNWQGIFSLPSDGNNFYRLWQFIYEGIFRTNMVLEKVSKIRRDKLPAIPFENEALREAILGEAYFMRGLHYFNLAIFFGDAPILTETPDNANFPGPMYKKRASRESVFQQAISDLNLAIAKLPTAWEANNKGRATSWAAKALLGKVYLHKACHISNNRDADFASSKSMLGDVIANGPFSLIQKNWASIFSSDNEYNSESVFEIGYAKFGFNGFFHDGGNAGENSARDLLFGSRVGGSPGFSELVATQDWVLRAEQGDPRVRQSLRFCWDDDFTRVDADGITKLSGLTYSPGLAKGVMENGNEIGAYFNVKKGVDNYEAGGLGGVFSSNNYRMIRFSDVLLMYAEAANETNDPSEAVAKLNMVRKRARGLATKYMSARIRKPMSTTVPFRGVLYDGLINTLTGLLVEGHGPIRQSTSNPTNIVRSFDGFPGTTEVTFPDSLNEINTRIVADYPYDTNSEFDDSYNYIGRGNDKLAIREALVYERRVELAFEYHRFMDMQRWQSLDPTHPGAAEEVFKNPLKKDADKKAYIPSIHRLCPLPLREIDLSRGTLVQNPGY